MKSPPKIGSTHVMTLVVTPEQGISFAGLPQILATPWMIWNLEHAALDLLKPHLDAGEISVGTRVEVDHLSAARVGSEVSYSARLVLVDGDNTTFQVEARCGERVLSRGLHKRRVVAAERLRRRLESL